MVTTFRPLGAAALTGLLSLAAAAQIPGPHAPPYAADTVATIETSGRRDVRIAPDRATIILALETRASTAAGAAQINAKTQRAVIDTLRLIGLAPGQMATAGFTVQPYTETGPNGISQRAGFMAYNAIVVTLTQLDRIGAVIDAALARGATNVGGVTFSNSNAADLRLTVLADAAAQAKAEATVLAKAMGGTLGPLLSVSTEYEGPRPVMAARAMAAAPETPIMPGEITLSAAVVARWQFVPNPTP